MEDGKISRLVPHKGHPKGICCTRGTRAREIVYSPDRLLHPLKRVGKRGSGEFIRTTWDEALDIVAERIRALGHPAPGTYKEFVKLASIKEVEGVPKSDEMIRHLVDAQEATARTARKLFPVVEAAGDQPTADLLTQRLEVHEKTAWMLRSLLED